MKFYFHTYWLGALLLLAMSCTKPTPAREAVQPAAPTLDAPTRDNKLGQYRGVLLTPPGHYTLDVLPGRTSAVVTLGDITYRIAANHSAQRKKRTLSNLDLEMTVDRGTPGDKLQLSFVLDGQPMKRTIFRVADQPQVHNYLSDVSALTMSPSTYTLLQLDTNGLPVAISGKVRTLDPETIRLESKSSETVLELKKMETGWTSEGLVFDKVN